MSDENTKLYRYNGVSDQAPIQSLGLVGRYSFWVVCRFFNPSQVGDGCIRWLFCCLLMEYISRGGFLVSRTTDRYQPFFQTFWLIVIKYHKVTDNSLNLHYCKLKQYFTFFNVPKIIVVQVGSKSSFVYLWHLNYFGTNFLHTNASVLTSSFLFRVLVIDVFAARPHSAVHQQKFVNCRQLADTSKPINVLMQH